MHGIPRYYETEFLVPSGSHIMAFVLAERKGWLTSADKTPFTIVPQGNFASLRAAVADGRADAFMWEWFTSKRYFPDSKPNAADAPIRPLGTIPTPWPSWLIACAPQLVGTAREGDGKADRRLEALFAALDKGIEHFGGNPEDSVRHISTELDYSEGDATEWMKTVRFVKKTRGVEDSVLESVLHLLSKAGVLEVADTQREIERMAGIRIEKSP